MLQQKTHLRVENTQGYAQNYDFPRWRRRPNAPICAIVGPFGAENAGLFIQDRANDPTLAIIKHTVVQANMTTGMKHA
ncbi:MAG: hypothetical protein ABI068_06140 [Ktedonobacterales bacterium]